MARTAVVNVKWTEYDLETAITLDVPDPTPILRSKLSIDNISGLVNTSSYSHVNPSQEEIYYQITLSDDIGTTEEEFIEEFQDGSLTITCSNSSGGISVKNGHLSICFFNHTTALRTLTITASDGNVSGTYSVVDPPYSSTLYIRYYENTELTTSRNSQPQFTDAWQGVDLCVCITNSGTTLSAAVTKEFVTAGIITGTFFSASEVTENGDNWTYTNTTTGSSTTTKSVSVAWNGGLSYSYTINHVIAWSPESSRTYAYIVIAHTTGLTSSNVVDGISFIQRFGSSTWDTSQTTTYNGTITASDLAAVIENPGASYLMLSTALGLTDTRLSADHLCKILQTTVVSTTAASIKAPFSELAIEGWYQSEDIYTNLQSTIRTNLFVPSSGGIQYSDTYSCSVVLLATRGCYTATGIGYYLTYTTETSSSGDINKRDPNYIRIRFKTNFSAQSSTGYIYSYLIAFSGYGSGSYSSIQALRYWLSQPYLTRS